MTIFDILTAQAATRPDAVAIDALDGQPLSYAALRDRVTARIADLTPRLQPGVPVALQRDHGRESAELELALLAAAIPVLSLPGFFTADQSRHATGLCGAAE